MVYRDVQLQITSSNIEATGSQLEKLSSFDSETSENNLLLPSTSQSKQSEELKSPVATKCHYVTLCINNGHSDVCKIPPHHNSTIYVQIQNNNDNTKNFINVASTSVDVQQRSPCLGAIPKVKIIAATPSEDNSLPHYENIEIFRHCERHNKPSSPRPSSRISSPNNLTPTSTNTFTHLCEVHHRPSDENLNLLKEENNSPSKTELKKSPILNSKNLLCEVHHRLSIENLQIEDNLQAKSEHSLQVDKLDFGNSPSKVEEGKSPNLENKLLLCEVHHRLSDEKLHQDNLQIEEHINSNPIKLEREKSPRLDSKRHPCEVHRRLSDEKLQQDKLQIDEHLTKNPIKLEREKSPRLDSNRHPCEIHRKLSAEKLHEDNLQTKDYLTNPIKVERERSPKLDTRHHLCEVHHRLSDEKLHHDNIENPKTLKQERSPNVHKKRYMTIADLLQHDSSGAVKHTKPLLRKSASEQVQLETQNELQYTKSRRSFSHRESSRRDEKDDLPKVHRSSSKKGLKKEMECSKV